MGYNLPSIAIIRSISLGRCNKIHVDKHDSACYYYPACISLTN
jgi:hypothetical protein